MIKRLLLLLIFVSGTVLADIAPVEEGSHNFNQWQLAKNEKQPSYEAYDEAIAQQAPVDANPAREDMQLLLNKLSALQQEVANLRGELEEQGRVVSQLKSRQNVSAHDVKKKAVAKEVKPTLKESIRNSHLSGLTLKKNESAADEQGSYKSAFELVKNRQYDDARLALKDFLHHFPNGKFAPNAQYWLGELYLLERNYNMAFDAFNTIVRDFPDSQKKPSALYKLAVTYGYLGQREKARTTFLTVTKDYPDTAVARLSQAKLSEY